MNDKTQKPAPDHGEPWQHEHNSTFSDKNGTLFLYGWGFSDRIVECVNACAGMADPSAEIQAMREAIKEVGRIITSIQLADIFEDTMRNHATLALAKLKPFLP